MRHRSMYHTAGLTDLDKMRKDANTLAKGDARHSPTSVVIHHHRYGVTCEGMEHEIFEPGDAD